MFKLLSSLALATCITAASADAQCSDLSITGSVAPGATISFDVTGPSAAASTIVLMSLEAGPLSVELPFGTLDLGILPPFAPVGATASFSITLPDAPVAPPGVSFDLYFQALSVDLTLPTMPPVGGGIPSLFTFCESDVETLTVGSGS